MIYQAYAISHGGKIRSNNEDNFYLNGKYRTDNNLFSTEASFVTEKAFRAAVFDGIGGAEKGEVASYIAARTMDEAKSGLLGDGLISYIRNVNRRIQEAGNGKEMGSTCVILNISSDMCWFSNVGDSRGYLYRNHSLKKMTKDHNLVTELYEQGLFTKEQAMKHPERHAIYQYLGMKDEDDVMVEPYEHTVFAAREGDWYLLCSDGLTDMVEESRILEIMEETVSAEPDKEAETLAKRLVDEALVRGGRDNVTVLLIKVQGAEGVSDAV